MTCPRAHSKLGAEPTLESKYSYFWASLVAQSVKNLATMREIRVQSLHREDLLEKEMATHSSILVWEIPWTDEPGGLHPTGLLDMTW